MGLPIFVYGHGKSVIAVYSGIALLESRDVRIAGEDPKNLYDLVKSGDLARIGGAYVLTEKGVNTRGCAAEDLTEAHCIEITGVVAEWVANALIDDGKLAVPAA